jgi:anti-anti-sigma factor
MTRTMALHGRLTGRARDAVRPGADEKPSPDRKALTYPVAEDIGPVTFSVLAGPAVVVAAIRGDLDIASAPAVRERLLSLLRPGACRLVIDMSAVRYADASGLAVLVSTQRRAVLLGGWLRLAGPGPEVAGALAVTGLSGRLAVYPTVRAAVAGRKHDPAVTAASVPTAQAQAEPDAGSSELHAAVAALLTDADAWRDADPRRRFSPALRALAQAHAGNSHPALMQAARSLLLVLGREPLTYSPVVAATASRLRRLFPAGRRPAMGAPSP